MEVRGPRRKGERGEEKMFGTKNEREGEEGKRKIIWKWEQRKG